MITGPVGQTWHAIEERLYFAGSNWKKSVPALLLHVLTIGHSRGSLGVQICRDGLCCGYLPFCQPGDGQEYKQLAAHVAANLLG